jgi:hypothetical protein
MGGWVGLKADLNAVEKRKILPCQEANPGWPAHSPSLYQLSYPNSFYFYGRAQKVKNEKITMIHSNVFIVVKMFKLFDNLLFQKPK